MVELNNYLKEFIKENLEDIQAGNFLDVYRKFDLTSSYDCFQCSKFTQAMYNAGIDPLKHTNGIIPECFLFENQEIINNNLIPKNCTSIWEQAFSGCILKEVIIPSTCLDIREYSLGSASIDKLVLDCSDNCNIWVLAFENTSINNMYLNHFSINTNFISQVYNIKNLYLPTDDMDLIANWVRNHNKNYQTDSSKWIQNKVNNVISNITGEVLDIDNI